MFISTWPDGLSVLPKKLHEKTLTNHKNSPDDFSPPRCRKCEQPIAFYTDDAPLDRFGQFVRLSCSEPRCGHVDWYKEVQFESTVALFSTSPDGVGEVWVHDIILGLSFKQTDDRV